MEKQYDFNKFCEVIDAESGAHFMMVKMKHSRMLNGDGTSVLVLSYFFNQLQMKRRNPNDIKQLKRNKGWFKCPATRIQDDLGMHNEKQQRAVKKLIERKLIETSYRAGNQLWVRLILDSFSDSGKSGFRETRNQIPGNTESDSGKHGIPLTNNPTKNLSLPASRAGRVLPSADGNHVPSKSKKEPPNGSDAPFSKPTQGKILADLFYALGKAKGKITFPPNKKTMRAWGEDFSEGLKTMSFGSIKAVIELNWNYCDRRFWPKAYSPKAFFAKWNQIEEAAAREMVSFIAESVDHSSNKRPWKEQADPSEHDGKVRIERKGRSSKRVSPDRLVPPHEAPGKEIVFAPNRENRARTKFAWLDGDNR